MMLQRARPTLHKTLRGNASWKSPNYPAYSQDAAPSDFFLFRHLKKNLGGRRFIGNDDLKEVVDYHFQGREKSFFFFFSNR